MKICMCVGIAGADFSLSPGDVTERFSDAEAERLIAAGSAVRVKHECPPPVVPAAPPAVAAVAPAEVATSRRKKG